LEEAYSSVVSKVLEGERSRGETNSSCLPPFSVVEHHPVVHAVLRLARVLEYLGEERSPDIVVGGLFKAEFADVVEGDGELFYPTSRR
jgi:hypothetical protein